MHYSRNDITERLGSRASVALVLAESDTAWIGFRDAIAGPGAVAYHIDSFGPYFAGFDPVAGNDDERCEYIREGGDRCMLIDGDHGTAHFYDED